MTRSEQVAQAEANLALLRGNVVACLGMVDLSCGGAVLETRVEPEFDERGMTGAAIIIRNGVRYRVTVDYA